MRESASFAEAVTTIVLFRVPPENSVAFVDAWTASNDFMSAQPGLIGGTLFQATSEGADHLFVNVATWTSQAALDAARAEHAGSLAAQGIDQKALWASLGVSVSPGSYRAHTNYAGPGQTSADAVGAKRA